MDTLGDDYILIPQDFGMILIIPAFFCCVSLLLKSSGRIRCFCVGWENKKSNHANHDCY